MNHTHIDHIAITASTLSAGAEFIRSTLGVEPQPGGQHPRMGTHNRLLRLDECLYLEIIAPNPGAPAPGRPRWFGLDDLHSEATPSLSAWVIRVGDIHESAGASSESLGEIETMSRGALEWLITIPADGSVPVDGVAPALIEWRTGTHPATGLPDQGLSLVELEIFHPRPERISRLLSSLALEGPVTVSSLKSGVTPYLLAHIDTPEGLRRLSV